MAGGRHTLQHQVGQVRAHTQHDNADGVFDEDADVAVVPVGKDFFLDDFFHV